MVVDRVSENFSPGPPNRRRYGRAKQDVHSAQQTIYNYLLEIVKRWPPDDVLEEFKNLYFHHSETVSSETVPALYAIVFSNNEKEFQNTLKRSCYILINNWEVAREHQPIQDLVHLFSDSTIRKPTVSPTLKRLRQWLIGFAESRDFKDLELFVASRFASQKAADDLNWPLRYTSYLLVPQYIDTANPYEQREAARAMSRRLKDKFKFDLALYTAYSQDQPVTERQRPNPTALGDGALRLIKAIVAKRGQFSYRNLANIFQEQTDQISYRSYKRSLVGYLIYSVDEPDVVKTLKSHLYERLEPLYSRHDDRPVDNSLILRTSNRVIDYLMTEDKEKPSDLFTMLLSRGNPLTLAVVLLKLVLISRNSHPYLEARIADLIHYYQQFPRHQCQWIINFLEIYSVTFAIYSGDVEYNLVRIENEEEKNASVNSDYRVFSQMTPKSFTRAQAEPVIAEELADIDHHLEDLDFETIEGLETGF
ncbi:MAG: hypothetical protein AAF921_22485 [Cyanobacteria bacterium P01_D01_bin.44]